MKYKTSDLSKILNVSANTIRRFENMGYLNSYREEENGYRYFDESDVTKTVFISKYRKIGFGHEEISQIFGNDIMETKEMFQARLEEMDKQIAHLTAVRHMLKDDINLMKRVDDYGTDIIEKPCNPFYYVLYHKDGKLKSSGKNGEMLYHFMYQCPEIKYIYLFNKDDLEKGRIVYNEGIAIQQQHAYEYGITIEKPVELYASRPSIMGVVRLPINFMDEDRISREQLRKIIYGDFCEYMKEKGYVLVGDVIGIKIGFSRETKEEWQYVLLSYPVAEKS